MKTLQKFSGLDFLKVIGIRILGKQGDEMKKKIFDASSEKESRFFGDEREVK
jgi:hypothetical protein